MMRMAVVGCLVLGWSLTALAQGGEAPPATPAAEPAVESSFLLERGLYVSGDFGFFFTLGGTKTFSNLQAYEGVAIGYDLNDMFSLQAGIGFGYSSNSAAVSEAAGPTDACPEGMPVRGDSDGDGIPDLCTGVQDFGMTMFGAAFIVSFLAADRAAVEVKLGGGGSYVSPSPDGTGTMGGHVQGGVGFKYLTLMTDFTVGVDATFSFHFPWGIPALAITPVVRYTF